MKINTENIEQWMFDFHEGMLSEPDKAELLNFLHNHPELNAEFGLWAQTHALKNEQVAIPANLLEGILKPVSVPFYYNKFVLGTITGFTISTLIICYFLLKPTVQKIKTQSVIKSEVPLIIVHESKKGSTTIKPNKTVNLKKNTQQVENPAIQSNDEQIIVSQPDTVIKITEVIELKEEQKVTYSKTDSVVLASENKSEEKYNTPDLKEKPAASAKKKKNRLPLNVKPQSQFKPANPNF